MEASGTDDDRGRGPRKTGGASRAALEAFAGHIKGEPSLDRRVSSSLLGGREAPRLPGDAVSLATLLEDAVNAFAPVSMEAFAELAKFSADADDELSLEALGEDKDEHERMGFRWIHLFKIFPSLSEKVDIEFILSHVPRKQASLDNGGTAASRSAPSEADAGGACGPPAVGLERQARAQGGVVLKVKDQDAVVGGVPFLDGLRCTAALKGNSTFSTWYDDGGKKVDSYTFQGLWEDAGIIAHHLRKKWNVDKGDRVVLCYSFGLHFYAAFFGCLRAGATAVVVYPPGPPLKRSLPKLNKVISDCSPVLVLTGSDINMLRHSDQMNPLSSSRQMWPKHLEWKVTDKLVVNSEPRSSIDRMLRGLAGVRPRESFDEPGIVPSDLAFLQYTSGSTGDPKGVMVTFSALDANVKLYRGFWEKSCADDGGMPSPWIGFSWLPQYHDLGLIGSSILPFASGWTMHMMSPFAFLKQPLLWLDLMSRHRVSWSNAPDFAIRYVARKFNEARRKNPDPIPGLDLSSLHFVNVCAEPIYHATPSALDMLCRYGLRKDWFIQGYGLAEHVVAACWVHGAFASKKGSFTACGDRKNFVSSVDIKIVSGESFEELPDGQVGEIWLAGPSVTAGYFGKKDLSKEVFQARLKTGSKRNFLRTGDLGFFEDGRLFVCGREKDLIIANGVNYFPHDIEFAGQNASAAVRPGCIAAFSSDDAQGGGAVEVVFEIRGHAERDVAAVCRDIRAEVTSATGLLVTRLVAIKERTIPKTTSGKIRRRASRSALQSNSLQIVYEDSRAFNPGDAEGYSEEKKAEECAEMSNAFTLDQAVESDIKTEKELRADDEKETTLQLFRKMQQDGYWGPNVEVECEKQNTARTGEVLSESSTIDEIRSAVEATVRKVIAAESSQNIDHHRSLLETHLDSLGVFQLAQLLQSQFGVDLPSTFLFSNPTIADISHHLFGCMTPRLQESLPSSSSDESGDELPRSCLDTVKSLIDFAEGLATAELLPAVDVPNIRAVLLTGATGFFGRHFIADLLNDPNGSIQTVYCPVRAESDESAMERIISAMEEAGIWQESHRSRIVAFAGDLKRDNFGIAPHLFGKIAQEVDAVYHFAASIALIAPYEVMRERNCITLKPVLRLCLTFKKKHLFYASTLGIFPQYMCQFTNEMADMPIAENSMPEISEMKRLFPLGICGYNWSKFVNELVASHVSKSMGVPSAIFRLPLMFVNLQTNYTVADDPFVKFVQGMLQTGLSTPLVPLVTEDAATCSKMVLSISHNAHRKHTFYNCSRQSHRVSTAMSWMKAVGFNTKQVSYKVFRTASQELGKESPLATYWPLYDHFAQYWFECWKSRDQFPIDTRNVEDDCQPLPPKPNALDVLNSSRKWAMTETNRWPYDIRHFKVNLDIGTIIAGAHELCDRYSLDFKACVPQYAFDGLSRIVNEIDAPNAVMTKIAFDLTSKLESRINLHRLYQMYPEIDAEEITSPIFILGLNRTGTTFLHRMLDASSRVSCPRIEENFFLPSVEDLANDLPEDKEAERLGFVDSVLGELFSTLRGIHDMGVGIAEEDYSAHSLAFQSVEYDVMYELPKYREWLGTQSFQGVYADHRRWLKFVSWWRRRQGKAEVRQWCLKFPWHLRSLDALLAEYPDARIVQTHRPFRDVIASWCFLVESQRKRFFNHVNRKSIGKDQLKSFAISLQRAEAFRAKHPQVEQQWLDIDFEAIVAEPVESALKVMMHAGLEPDLPAVELISNYVAKIASDRKTKTHPTHDISNYGISSGDCEIQCTKAQTNVDVKNSCHSGPVISGLMGGRRWCGYGPA